MNDEQDLDDNVLTSTLQNKQMKGIYLKMKMHASNSDVNNYREMILMVKELDVDVVV